MQNREKNKGTWNRKGKSKNNTGKKIKKLLENKIVFVIFVAILIIGSVLGMIFLKKIIGYAVVYSQGGTITELTIERRDPTQYWQGFYGLALMLRGYDEVQWEEATANNVESIFYLGESGDILKKKVSEFKKV